MKILTTTGSNKFAEKNDYRGFLKIDIDGKTVFEFLDGEPEDANLGRDFNDCFRITSAMQKAYEAGKAGEEFLLERREIDDFEY